MKRGPTFPVECIPHPVIPFSSRPINPVSYQPVVNYPLPLPSPSFVPVLRVYPHPYPSHSKMLLSNLFFFLSFVTLIIAQQPVEIGTLTTRAHDVTGTVFALNSRQLSVQGLHYDGLGPDAYFWVGTGSTPNADGMRVPFLANCSIPGPLPAYNDATVELELLNNLQLADIGHFSIWCEKVSQNFGEVVVDAGDLQGVPTLGQSTCVDSDSEKVEPFPVPDRWNCEPLNDDYQVRWVVNNSNIVIELVGRIDETQYMGFGVSGSDTNTNMTYRCVKQAERVLLLTTVREQPWTCANLRY